MDADLIREFDEMLQELTEEDLVTIQAMREKLSSHQAAMQFELMGVWSSQGWRPAAPGMRCQECGGNCWYRDEGFYEVYRCVDVMCGVSRRVKVG